MQELDLILYIGFFLRLLTLIFTVTFIIRYSKRPWRSLPEGRHLMGFSCVVGLFMLFSVVNNFAAWLDPDPPMIFPDGDYPGRDWIAIILFAFTAYYMYERNRLLTPEARTRQDKQDEDDKHDDRLN